MNLENRSQAYSQHALYIYSNKYANVKSEMASSFIRELLAEKGGNGRAMASGLTETLKELSLPFFPTRSFLDHNRRPTGVWSSLLERRMEIFTTWTSFPLEKKRYCTDI